VLDEWKGAKRNGGVGNVGGMRADKGREVDRWLRPPFEERGFLCNDVQVEAKNLEARAPQSPFEEAPDGHVSNIVARPPSSLDLIVNKFASSRSTT